MTFATWGAGTWSSGVRVGVGVLVISKESLDDGGAKSGLRSGGAGVDGADLGGLGLGGGGSGGMTKGRSVSPIQNY